MLIHKYVDWNGLAAIVVTKCQQVPRQSWIWVFYCMQVVEEASEGIQSGFET